MGKMVIVRAKRSVEDANSAPVRPTEDEFIGDMPRGMTGEEILALHERVADLCERNKRVSTQARRIRTMSDEEFDPDTAVGLLQRIAVLDGMATVLGKKLEDIGFAEDAIQTCRDIRSGAELMYSDLKRRLSGED